MMPSAFMGGRLVGLAAHDAYLLQAPFTLLAVGRHVLGVSSAGAGGAAVAIFLLSTVIATPYIHS